MNHLKRYQRGHLLLGSNSQKGIALFIALVLLLVLTIAGVSAVQTTSLEERMARNTHDTLIAFQAAEAAIRHAEDWMDNNVAATAAFQDTGPAGMWSTAGYNDVDRWYENDVWTGNTSVEVPVALGNVSAQPRYIIEWVATVESTDSNATMVSSYASVFDRVEIFRITALGTGGNAATRVMLQATYGKIF